MCQAAETKNLQTQNDYRCQHTPYSMEILLNEFSNEHVYSKEKVEMDFSLAHKIESKQVDQHVITKLCTIVLLQRKEISQLSQENQNIRRTVHSLEDRLNQLENKYQQNRTNETKKRKLPLLTNETTPILSLQKSNPWCSEKKTIEIQSLEQSIPISILPLRNTIETLVEQIQNQELHATRLKDDLFFQRNPTYLTSKCRQQVISKLVTRVHELDKELCSLQELSTEFHFDLRAARLTEKMKKRKKIVKHE